MTFPFFRSRKNTFLTLCSIALIFSMLCAMAASLRWPLVGDASLMHYVVFLQHQGLVPYRDIVDINLPGTYFFEAIAMRCFGPGALGWRIYDLFLLILVLLAAMKLAGRKLLFAGLFSGSLFALVHLQDGLEQGGQRNLLMAVLLLLAYAALFQGQETVNGAAMVLLAGLALGCTVIIKPTVLPLAISLIAAASVVAYRRGRGGWSALGAGAFGLALPSALRSSG